MISKIKEWFYWNDYIILPIAGFITFCIAIGGIVLLSQANVYKFNCNLSHRPDLYTTAFIANDTYAYNPKLFCDTLKEKMHK